MTGDVMVFAALVAAPASSFLCGYAYLGVFALFPAAALLERRFSYFRNLFFLAFAPAAVYVWSVLSGHSESAAGSLRWICAVAAGGYFAGALGPGGIASVLGTARMIPPVRRLSETMLLAGGAASSAKRLWKENRELPLRERVTATLTYSIRSVTPAESHPGAAGAVSISVAVLSWAFLLAAVSGRTG